MPIFQNHQQARVLVVDDNPMGRQMLRAMLENVGIQVSEAENGIEAVDRVDAEEFDLVLMDIQMPALDGRSAARAIRNLGKNYSDNLPIIAMTAHSFDDFRVESLAAGMNGHIAKPIELETLYAELQRWLPVEKLLLIDGVSAGEDADYSDLEAALPGVDVKAGIRRVAGKRSLYLELLRKFVEQFSVTEIELHKELAAGRQKNAIRRAHTLRGVAGGLGAKQLQKLAKQLEGQLTRQEPPTVLAEVFLELDRLLAAIKALPALNRPEEVKDKLLGTGTELREILKQLLEPLKTLQAPAAKQQLAQLKEKDWPEEYADRLLQLDKLIEQYQFKPAVKLVESFLLNPSP
ncbi:MAG: response regulator [Desulfuromusa sp.]|nr:response regulator [Desulfuromusa sp.]